MTTSPRPLGATLPPVFPIGLGLMGKSEFYGATDDAQSLATLARALELGVTLFDTANTYGLGHNETLLGRFIDEGGADRRARTQEARSRVHAQIRPVEPEARFLGW